MNREKIGDAQFKKIVSDHAAAAAVAALAAAVPLVGTAVANFVAFGFICTMYVRLANYLEFSMSKGFIRALATSVISQIAAVTVARIAVGTVLSLIPGFGTVGAIVLTGATVYASTIVAAEIFKRIIVLMMDSDKDISSYTEEDLSHMVEESMSKDELKTCYKAATDEYKEKKDSGELDKCDKVEMMDEFKEDPKQDPKSN